MVFLFDQSKAFDDVNQVADRIRARDRNHVRRLVFANCVLHLGCNHRV